MISIVIPAYNEGEAILDQLQELFDGHRVEQCVVVDASETQSFESVREKIFSAFPEKALNYIAANIKGRGAQMNTGAANSEGSILLFLHADTQLPEGALAQIQQGVGKGWHWGRFDVRFDNTGWPYRMIASTMNWRSRTNRIATGDQAMFMTRAAFDLVNGYDEIALMEDIEMSKKLKTIGPPLCHEAKVQTAARRWENKGMIRTILLMWWLRLAYSLGVSPERLASWYR